MWLEHPSSQRLVLRSCRRGLPLAELLLIVLVGCPICATHAQQPQVLPYRFAIGDPSRGVSSGSVWLYSYSWYGLQSTKLTDIQNGVAEIPLDMERIRRELNPHPNTDAYVLVFQFPQNIWFRSPEISPESIWKDFTQVLNGLGQTTTLPEGARLLTLPALVRRRITLFHEDGRPVVKAPLSVSIFFRRDEKPRVLSADELQQLFAKRTLTVKW